MSVIFATKALSLLATTDSVGAVAILPKIKSVIFNPQTSVVSSAPSLLKVTEILTITDVTDKKGFIERCKNNNGGILKLLWRGEVYEDQDRGRTVYSEVSGGEMNLCIDEKTNN